MSRTTWISVPLATVTLVACGDSVATSASEGATSNVTATATTAATTAGPTTTGSTASSGGSETGSSSGSSGSETGSKFDVGVDVDVGGPVDLCNVSDDGDAPAPCADEAPPGAFEPDVQWTWMGSDGDGQSMVIPLVANLTDDNNDGAVDLCDTPDILVVAFPEYFNWNNARLSALDGATGEEHWKADTLLDAITAPALGDIDGDGLVEIVSVSAAGQLVAFNNDGSLAWTGDQSSTWAPAVAIADLGSDGSIEIIAGSDVYDAGGTKLWTASEQSGPNPANTAADLDGDGDLELVLGHAAFQEDGALLWSQPDVTKGFPTVADFDDDGEPEILISSDSGLTMLEGADGSIIFNGLTPNGDPPNGANWRRPSTAHDFDGDGAVEFAVSSADHYGVFESDAMVVWSSVVDDGSGTAAGTAFDFLGDGVAEAMYADEFNLFIFDGSGTPVLTVPRSSGTGKEYPVVADVDNDGSAEIVVTSNASYMGQPQTAPLVQVIRDIEDRWIPARRIWNQHTYHVTNIREDGTIPTEETPHWEALNTFRTQSQINPNGGGVCKPPG